MTYALLLLLLRSVFSLARLDADVPLDADIRTALRGGPRTKAGGDLTEEEPILDETLDGSKEATQRTEATRNWLRASGLVERPSYGELSCRPSAALAMGDAAFVEARHGSVPGKRRARGQRMSSREHYA
jgi:hypothetical protein